MRFGLLFRRRRQFLREFVLGLSKGRLRLPRSFLVETVRFPGRIGEIGHGLERFRRESVSRSGDEFGKVFEPRPFQVLGSRYRFRDLSAGDSEIFPQDRGVFRRRSYFSLQIILGVHQSFGRDVRGQAGKFGLVREVVVDGLAGEMGEPFAFFRRHREGFRGQIAIRFRERLPGYLRPDLHLSHGCPGRGLFRDDGRVARPGCI